MVEGVLLDAEWDDEELEGYVIGSVLDKEGESES
jgi:hypothetical protein